MAVFCPYAITSSDVTPQRCIHDSAHLGGPLPQPSLSVLCLSLTLPPPHFFESVSVLLRGKLSRCLMVPAASLACVIGPGPRSGE